MYIEQYSISNELGTNLSMRVDGRVSDLEMKKIIDAANLQCRSAYLVGMPEIKDVIFNNPATIIQWVDGTKSVVKVQPGDTYDPEKGMLAAIAKRAYGNNNTFNKIVNKWLGKWETETSIAKKEERHEDTFRIGDHVAYCGNSHISCPEWYPSSGVVGVVCNVGADSLQVQWPIGSTSRDDRWSVSKGDVKLVKIP